MEVPRSLGGAQVACRHLPSTIAEPSASRCEACGIGVTLRMCATCGSVGCCESQAGDAKRHALDAGHPVIGSMPVGAGFSWCYEDRTYVG